MPDEPGTRQKTAINRRGLLRRVGAAGAGVAGVAVVGGPAVVGPAAVTARLPDGAAHTAENDADATLVLANTSTVPGSRGTQAGPALRLVPAGDFPGGPVGSLGISSDGTLYLVAAPDTADY